MNQFGRAMEQIEGDTAVSRFYKGIEVREMWDHKRQQSEIVIDMLTLVSSRRTTRGQKMHLLKKLRERRDLLAAMIKAGEQELAEADARRNNTHGRCPRPETLPAVTQHAVAVCGQYIPGHHGGNCTLPQGHKGEHYE